MRNVKMVRGHLRGLEVLRALNDNDYATVQEISRACDLPRPTIYRLLDTLVEAGYVERIESGDHYCLRSQVAELSKGFDEHARAVELARPYVQELAQESGWPTYIFAYDELRHVMVARHVVRSPKEVGRPKVGAIVPILLSSPGRAYMANLDQPIRQALVDQLLARRSFGRYAPIDASHVARAIRDSQALGVGIRDNDMIPRTTSFSVPICRNGKPLIFVTLMSMRSVMSLNRSLDTYLSMTRRATACVEERLQAAAELETAGC